MKPFVANHTYIGFLSGMIPHDMPFQTARIIVPFIAMGTNKWSLTRMNPSVHF